MSQSAFFSVKFSASYIPIGNRVRFKTSGMAPGLANARPPGSAKFANVPPPGLTRRANAPQCRGGGGGWAQVELTDALQPRQFASISLHLRLYANYCSSAGFRWRQKYRF